MNAIYNNVYNYYVPTRSAQSTGRFDSHKKSELRNVYNTIVKLNKESPLYKFNFTDEVQKYAVDLKENSRNLKNTINDLTSGDTEQLFNKRVAASSDEDAVETVYVGEPGSDYFLRDFSVEVTQLASAQINRGHYIEPNKLGLIEGMYSFDININNLDYEFQFSVTSQDTNKSLQEKIARLVNKSSIGLNASVLEDDEGKTALEIRSTNTGNTNEKNTIFNISDANSSKAAGSVLLLGIGTITEYPKNAVYKINGSEHSSTRNTVLVGKSFELTLKKITEEEPVTVGFVADTDAITEHIKTFVAGYNSFLELAQEYHDTQPSSSKLAKDFSVIANNHKNDLESIGLIVQNDGIIEIDEALLTQATADEQSYTENINRMNGFKDSILAKTQQTFINPMEYVDKLLVAYKNPARESFATPYITSLYSGMMFNSYC